uniref:Solute carrier family 25 member 45 n=1 Tax=Sphenodon punctatus TaxID=8508 RepID=A0A8D0HUW5_SPHPU
MSAAEFIAGWLSGLVVSFQVRLQTQSRYRSILHCVLRTYREETQKGAGNSFPLDRGAGNQDSWVPLLPLSFLPTNQAAHSPPLLQAVVLAPVDLIKVRLQNQTHPFSRRSLPGGAVPQYRGPVHCAVSILREEGLTGLFRGTRALMLRDTPSMAVYFLTYTGLCRGMTAQGKEPDSVTFLIAGGCAGTASWASATPMDVIKARLQMDGVKGVAYRGILDCILTSVREEGLRVLLKGLTLNSIRAFPVNAIIFLSYEHLLKLCFR